MTDPTPSTTIDDAHVAFELSSAAWQEWSHNVDSILRGVAHALNNRATALSALIELASDGDAAESTTPILETEMEKVRDLSAVVRTVGMPRQGIEAFAPRDAAEDASAVLRMHAGQRERVTLIEAG